jgi:hypothetical protein
LLQGAAPADGKPHQGEGIGTAGHRQHKRGCGLPVREQIFRLLYRNRRVVVVSHGIASLFEAFGGPDQHLL